MEKVTNKLKRAGEGGNTMSEELDLRELKQFIYEEVKSNPILRDRILDKPDKVWVREFLEKFLENVLLELSKKRRIEDDCKRGGRSPPAPARSRPVIQPTGQDHPRSRGGGEEMSTNHKNSVVGTLESWRQKLLQLESEVGEEIEREATSSGAEGGEEKKGMESNRKAES